MTENDILKYLDNLHLKIVRSLFAKNVTENEIMALIECKKQLQQYLSIGTVEECREAREKQNIKLPMIKPENQTPHYENDIMAFCPTCNKRLHVKYKERYCCGCGQRLGQIVKKEVFK